MRVTPLVVDEGQDRRLIRVVIPRKHCIAVHLLDPSHICDCQITIRIPLFELTGQFRITDQNNRKEFIAAELTRYVLKVGNQLVRSLILDLFGCRIRLLNDLLCKAGRVVPGEADLIAKDESVIVLRIYQVCVLGARRIRQQLTLDRLRQDVAAVRVELVVDDEGEEQVDKDETGEALKVLGEPGAGGRQEKLLVHAEDRTFEFHAVNFLVVFVSEITEYFSRN